MHLNRVVLALGLALAGVIGSGSAAGPLLRAGTTDFPALLAGTTCVIHALVSAWLLVAVLVVTSSQLARRPTPHWLAPRWLLVALVVGGGLAPSAASADPADHLTGLPLPDRAAMSGPPAPTAPHAVPDPVAPSDPPGTHVVSPGDTLWSIASGRLPESAADAEVAADVAHWHTTNRAVIGPDPDLLRPGQVLTPPQEPTS